MKRYFINLYIETLYIFNKFLLYKNHIRKDFDCAYVWHGSRYGGFYICESGLSSKSIIYSFGVGEDTSFDVSLATKFGCKINAFDPTPRSIDWFNSSNNHVHIILRPFGISKNTGLQKFYLPANNRYVSGSFLRIPNVNVDNYIHVQMFSFPDITKLLGNTKIDILKMDIEGAEYQVIDSILDSGIYIDQIVCEFHDRFFKGGKKMTADFVSKMKNKGYSIFAYSKTLEEVSFIKKRDFINN
jgi:FkbM family methyltransferase